MINKLRVLMLLLAVFIAGYGAHNFLSKFKATSENIDFRITEEGVDVKIKKFKVIHERLGHNNWELKADIAEINEQNETTKMSNVEYIYISENNRKFKVFADSGILKNKNNDLSLEGHVKMLIDHAIVKEKFKKSPTSKPQP